MCWWWGTSNFTPVMKELSTEGIKTVLHKLRDGIFSISIGGGEPLIREDFPEILEYAGTLDYKCEVLTNGTLITPEIANYLARYAYDLVISLEGPKEINDAIRGKGSFDKTVQGIKMVRDIKKVPIKLNCTISSLNYQHIKELIDIAHDLHCDVSFQHLIFTNPLLADEHKKCLKEHLGIDDDTIFGFINDLHSVDTNQLIKKLNNCWNKASQYRMFYDVCPPLRGEREIETWYSGFDSIPLMRCLFPWLWLFVRPNGDISPCEFINYSYGNLVEDDLESIWNNEKARHFREVLMTQEKMFPGCRRCCKLETCEISKG